MCRAQPNIRAKGNPLCGRSDNMWLPRNGRGVLGNRVPKLLQLFPATGIPRELIRSFDGIVAAKCCRNAIWAITPLLRKCPMSAKRDLQLAVLTGDSDSSRNLWKLNPDVTMPGIRVTGKAWINRQPVCITRDINICIGCLA